MAVKTAVDAPAFTPEQLQSVRGTLMSPRRLKTEVLGGLVVAIALIPEAIAFSIIAGVDPRVGLFSSFVMAVAISFLGGRPAMITAATGAIALVIGPVARESHGYGLLHRHRPPRRTHPGRPRCARGRGEAHAFHPR